MKVNARGLIAMACLTLLAGCGQAQDKLESQQQPGATTTTVEKSVEETRGGKVYEGTISGVISDSMCGKDHLVMGALGRDAVACSKKCVEQGAKFVLVDDKGVVYGLSDQKKPMELAGRAVSVEGHIDPTEKAIHVHSMAAR